MNNDFCVDTSKQVKADFLKKIEKPLGIALLLTGIETIATISYFVRGIANNLWNDIGVSSFVIQGVHYLSIACIFVALIKIIFDAKPFSHTLSVCMKIMSGFYLIGAFVYPRLPGFETNYNILKFGDFTLFDGNTLILGLLLYIFSIIIQEGFASQKEIEEMI